VCRLAKEKLAEVDQKLRELLAYRQDLAERIKQWDEMPDGAFDAAVCQLIELTKVEKAY
jgi:hypothetical protein